MLNGLDLFSGVGGIAYALKPWVRTVAYCELSSYRRGDLLSRMWAGDLEQAPIWDDVCSLRGADIKIPLDIISGGFPCQDISLAGSGAGLEGRRSRLFWEIIRLARELRPAFVFLENVPAVTSRGGIAVAGAFAALGFDARWGVLSAADVGAPHLRERWWFLAHAHGAWEQQQGGDISQGGGWPGHGRGPLDAAHAECQGFPEWEGARGEWPQPAIAGSGWWDAEPAVGRVAHGVSYRVERISALGDSVVWQTAREAFRRLSGLKEVRQVF